MEMLNLGPLCSGGLGNVFLTVGLSDLKGQSKPKSFYDSKGSAIHLSHLQKENGIYAEASYKINGILLVFGSFCLDALKHLRMLYLKYCYLKSLLQNF